MLNPLISDSSSTLTRTLKLNAPVSIAPRFGASAAFLYQSAVENLKEPTLSKDALQKIGETLNDMDSATENSWRAKINNLAGTILHRMGDDVQAARAFYRAQTLEPENPLYYFNCAVSSMRSGWGGENSIADFAKAVSLGLPKFPFSKQIKPLLLKGLQAFSPKESETSEGNKALFDLQALITDEKAVYPVLEAQAGADPEIPPVNIDLGDKLDPNSAEFQNLSGLFSYKAGKFRTAAERHFKKAIALAPLNPLYHFNYGVALTRCGEGLEQGMGEFAKAVKLGLPDLPFSKGMKEKFLEGLRHFSLDNISEKPGNKAFWSFLRMIDTEKTVYPAMSADMDKVTVIPAERIENAEQIAAFWNADDATAQRELDIAIKLRAIK